MLAALNHPNIGAIYGLEDAGGMPRVGPRVGRGPDAGDRIARGPLSLDDALPSRARSSMPSTRRTSEGSFTAI